MREGRRLRVGVMFGGRSSEHAVSLASARSVMAALDPAKYDTVQIGITKDGHWLVGGEPMKQLVSGDGGVSVPASALVPVEDRQLARRPRSEAAPPAGVLGSLDIIIPVLHGPNGEDGTVQGLLELAGIPYVGAGVLSSALGMDKVLMKVVFKQRNLPMPKHMVFLAGQLEQHSEVRRLVADNIGYPCFVKPANLGSSVGISKVHEEEELRASLAEAARYDRKILVEEFIDGHEVECSVLGNDDPVASAVGEIIPCNEFYDYRAKYVDQGSELVIPAHLPPAVAERVRRLAVEAFLAIDCCGMARVDFFVDRSYENVYISEINTIPGFTTISMYPKLWAASGLSYSELIDRLIDLGLERHAEKMRYQKALESIPYGNGGGVL